MSAIRCKLGPIDHGLTDDLRAMRVLLDRLQEKEFLPAAQWLASRWRQLPAYRVDLGGEAEEPLTIQWAGSPNVLAAVMEEHGWQTAPLPFASLGHDLCRFGSAASKVAGPAPVPERPASRPDHGARNQAQGPAGVPALAFGAEHRRVDACVGGIGRRGEDEPYPGLLTFTDVSAVAGLRWRIDGDTVAASA